MIVVADTSPLNYLVLLGKPDILPKIYGRVVVPTAVVADLSHPDAPPGTRGRREFIGVQPALLAMHWSSTLYVMVLVFFLFKTQAA